MTNDFFQIVFQFPNLMLSRYKIPLRKHPFN